MALGRLRMGGGVLAWGLGVAYRRWFRVCLRVTELWLLVWDGMETTLAVSLAL